VKPALESCPAIIHKPAFLSRRRADALLDWCTSTHVSWRREHFNAFGKRIAVPRLLAWFGDEGVNYRYTGLAHPAAGWPEELLSLRQAVENAAGCVFNFLLLNRYEGGRHHMGWHKDDEQGAAPLIASLSLGAIRRFRIQSDDGLVAYDLEPGSLLLFDGRLRHMLAPTRKEVGCRVNLTFRSIGTADA